jgi:hypothetical protein
MTTAKNELAAALCDVRKAYRLLHGYHRRVLDVASLVASRFDKVAWLATEFGCSPMTRRRNPFDQGYWMWDATPMVLTHFLFTEHGSGRGWETHHRPGDYLLDVTAVADSEFHDYEYGDEPDPAAFAKPPEAAASKMILTLITPCGEQKDKTWLKVWNNNDYPEHARAADWNDGSYRAYSETIAMEEFGDSDAAVRIAERFRNAAFSALQLGS